MRYNKLLIVILFAWSMLCHGKPNKMTINKMKSIPVGRFIIEIPNEASLRWGQTGYNGAGRLIKTFHAPTCDHIKKVFEHECNSMKLKHGDVEPKFENCKAGDLPNSYKIQFWNFPSQKNILLGIKAFYQKADRGYIFTSNADFTPEKINECEKELDNYFNKLSPRIDHEIPEGPGFCFEKSFFQGEPPQDFPNEHIAIHIGFPGHPDVFMRFSTDVVRVPQSGEDGLLARSSRHGNLFPGVTRIRARERKVGRYLGEELIKRVEAGKSVVGYLFTWEYNGPGESATDPAIMLELVTGWADPAVNSSLTQEEAMALWEKVLNSIRYRNTAPPQPSRTP